MPYDPIKDFTAVGMIGGTPNVLVVNAKLPIHNLKEFVAYAKSHSNMNYGSAGSGSLTHLLMELLQQQAGTKMVHIAYKGIAPAFTDLLGQQTQVVGRFWTLFEIGDTLYASTTAPMGRDEGDLHPSVATLLQPETTMPSSRSSTTWSRPLSAGGSERST